MNSIKEEVSIPSPTHNINSHRKFERKLEDVKSDKTYHLLEG